MTRTRRTRLAIIAGAILVTPAVLLALKVFVTDHSGLWFPAQVRDELSGRHRDGDATEHMIVLLADHWEPGNGEGAEAAAKAWIDGFREISARNVDSRGRPFRYSWFYPIDHGSPAVMDLLTDAVAEGLGEVEVHWHHHHDDSATFERDLVAGLADFRAAGLLPETPDGLRWAFVHGNWALDNSIEGQCGVDDEIAILQRHGCYMDMTFPALLMPSNPRIINRLLRFDASPGPRSYDVAREVHVGGDDDGFLLFQGPLGIDPAGGPVFVEYAALDDAVGTGLAGRVARPGSPRDYFLENRVRFWHRAGIGVEGRPEWTFVKLHAHGMEHADLMLGGLLDAALEELKRYAVEQDIVLHYVTAREAYNLVRAAERGLLGDPADFYDLEIPPAPAAASAEVTAGA